MGFATAVVTASLDVYGEVVCLTPLGVSVASSPTNHSYAQRLAKPERAPIAAWTRLRFADTTNGGTDLIQLIAVDSIAFF